MHALVAKTNAQNIQQNICVICVCDVNFVTKKSHKERVNYFSYSLVLGFLAEWQKK